MAVELAESRKEMKIIEESSLAFRLESEEKLSRLQSQIHKILTKRRRGGNSGQSRPKPSSQDSQLNSATSTTEPPFFEDEKFCVSSGDPCIFPFLYKGKNETSCVKNWYDIKP